MENLLVLGGGESGVGAALLGKAKGFSVFLSDGGLLKPHYQEELQAAEIPFETGQHSEAELEKADFVVKSPGIPETAEIVQTARKMGKPVISEIEFASRFVNGQIIAITGSNGKTTTTKWIQHILVEAGLNSGMAGNVGESFARLAIEDTYDYYVLEISSFQLDDIQEFKPYIAILLNITPDHLDRYQNQFHLYAQSKIRITQNQNHGDFLIYNLDDPKTVELLCQIETKAQLIPFSLKQKPQPGAFAYEDTLTINYPVEFTMKKEKLSLIGEHNVANSLAAATAANILKIRNKLIQQSLSNFDAVEHRLEKVLQIGGMQFINDSKATNVNAAYYALESMENPTIWIVGGVDKGNDYSELYTLVEKKVKAIVCLGTDSSRIVEAFADKVEHLVETRSMADAVQTAYKLGAKGDTVLLSPACASFDLFDNYEARGKQFKAAIKNL